MLVILELAGKEVKSAYRTNSLLNSSCNSFNYQCDKIAYIKDLIEKFRIVKAVSRSLGGLS